MQNKAGIGVFGGSGFYSLLDNVKEIDVDTPYGKPSDKIMLGSYKGINVAFMPRHSREHSIPPHKINYRANVYAMREMGVKRLLGPNASGSLNPDIKPGEFVVCDQFVDRTNGRYDTFYDGEKVKHISAAEPYCPELRNICVKAGKNTGIKVHEKGTVVVINGPRFSTKAESRWFSKMGWDVINMTQYPEGYLASELGICYANIALITDYDAGLEGQNDIKPVTHDEVLKVFNKNIKNIKKMVFRIIEMVNEHDFSCSCRDKI